MNWSELFQFGPGRLFFKPARNGPKANKETAVVKILFVCMANICRSPTAEGVFRRLLEDSDLADKIHVDSAGIHAHHGGAPPDRRSQEAAILRGADLSRLRTRRVELEDLNEFDYLLAMDRDNYEQLFAMAVTDEQRDKIGLLMDYAPHLPEREVPDPYYGGLRGFDRVLDLIEEASQGLLAHLRERYGL